MSYIDRNSRSSFLGLSLSEALTFLCPLYFSQDCLCSKANKQGRKQWLILLIIKKGVVRERKLVRIFVQDEQNFIRIHNNSNANIKQAGEDKQDG